VSASIPLSHQCGGNKKRRDAKRLVVEYTRLRSVLTRRTSGNLVRGDLSLTMTK
jgi:hypothetical protein